VPAKKKIMLFGSWKVDEKLDLIFEMPYEEGKIRNIIFGATCNARYGVNIDFRLKTVLQRDLGMNLKLSKSIFKGQGEAFLEALKEGKKISILAGAGFRW